MVRVAFGASKASGSKAPTSAAGRHAQPRAARATLLRARARVDQADIVGQTPLAVAEQRGHAEVVQALVPRGGPAAEAGRKKPRGQLAEGRCFAMPLRP